jgi:hypothetical protein
LDVFGQQHGNVKWRELLVKSEPAFYFIQPSFGPDAKDQAKTERNPLRFILLIILILLIIGALPTWPYSTGWGYYPSGGLGLLLVIVLLVVLLR